MGDEMSPIMSAPPSSIEGERNPAAQMALALVVLGMLLAVNSVLTDAWLVEEADLLIFLVAHDEFKLINIENKRVMDFCGVFQ